MFVFAFGVGAFVVLVLTTLYAIGFVEGSVVAFTVDGASGQSTQAAGPIVSVALLGLFAAVHWGMGRPDFRRSLCTMVPPALERSIHVLVSCVLLMLAFLRWTPMPLVVWDLGLNPLAFLVEMLSWGGWVLALLTAVVLDPLELFGLKQVLAHVRGRGEDEEKPSPQELVESPFHRWGRRPLHLGLAIAVWCAPHMTLGHLVFAALVSAYLGYLAHEEAHRLVLSRPGSRALPQRYRRRAG